MYSLIFALVACFTTSTAWMPQGPEKIRGVNLGSQFIVEPWMASDEWNKMGCGSAQSEFDCVSKLGQAEANTAWAEHWSTWTTRDDISQMQSYGLNTIRIPVGYWIREDIVYNNSEHFPQGGLQYLEQICGWASDAGMYVIIDLHGAPGAQVTKNADTGQVMTASSTFGMEHGMLIFSPVRPFTGLLCGLSVQPCIPVFGMDDKYHPHKQ